MQLSVLERVEPRKRRRRAPLVLLLVAALAAGASFAASRYWAGATPPASHAAVLPQPPTPRPSASPTIEPVVPPQPGGTRTQAAVPLLTTGTRVRHHFRPDLLARSAILVNARTGAVLWSRRAHVSRPIASTTKIMTGILALEQLSVGSKVTIHKSVPRTTPYREGLRAGERVRVWKLLFGLLLFSGNDDAVALAIGSAGTRSAFVGSMNTKAKELGLADTHFSSPSGVIDRRNRSSAWDLAALTRYAMRDVRFRAIVRTKIKRVRWAAPTYGKVYINRNDLLSTYRGADGVKTGWTTLAGHCLVASAHRHGVRLIAVVLNSRDAYRDARRLLNFGFRIQK